MSNTFRHNAAAVALPSSSAQRKYGQSLVLQQNQQKYAGQQAGYDRLFDAYKQDTQNRFQFGQAADQRVFQAKQAEAQNLFQLDRDQAKFDQQQQQQRKADFDAARNRIDTYAKDALSDPDLPHDLRQRIQNLVSGKMVALGGGYNGPAQQQFLDQYNSQLAAILSEIPPKQPKAPPQPNFHTDQNGNQWVESGPGKWEQVPQEKSARPLDFNEYYNAEENKGKFDKDLDATMQSMQDAADEGENPGKVTEEAALEEMKRRYEFRQKALGLVGDPTAAPELAGQAAPTSSPLQSILEQPTAAPAGIPITPPDEGVPPSPVAGKKPLPLSIPITPPDEGVPPSPVAGKKPLPLTSNSTSQWADLASADQQPSQQVKVDGKPLAVTPGTLTPQETAARSQIMALPREERIKALMPYDQELKGKTLEQILDDPETKKQYDELTKEGLTTGNYREDIIGHIDEMLQHNVLNAAGQSPPSAYAGMRADEITDPQLKAEVKKLPRPKNVNERNAIRRGQPYVDPDGIIRTRA